MKRNLSKPETIEGIVDSITFHNEENGFTVMVIDFHGDPLTVTGEIGSITEGELVKLFGEFSVHPRYGEQFYAVSAERSLPTGVTAIVKYLGSGAVKGVGKRTAKLITDAFGEDTFDILENYPERLAEIKGISKKKADEITESFRKLYGIRELSLFLTEFDTAPSVSAAAWKMWGHFAKDMITENPFLLCTEGIDLSFKKADMIADRLHIAQNNTHRVSAGIRYILRTNAFDGGHTCMPKLWLYDSAVRLLGVSEETVAEGIASCIAEKEISETEGEYYSLYGYTAAERYIAGRIARMAKAHTDFDYTEMIKVEEAGKGIVYAEKQKEAIGCALTSGLTVLTGGPGTGKTTTLNAIIALYKQRGMNVFIAAPTGKAAKRISELTGFAAKTIHRLLEVAYDSGDKLQFVHDEQNKLECDVCVVDEMSMVDSLLFEALLRALKHDCRLVLVGDSDQLPSVGAGNVLGDIIRSGVVHVVALNEIFRQAQNSGIITNAHKIVRGEYPDLQAADFFFMQRLSAEAAADTVTELITERLPKAYGFSPLDDIQVLCPSRKGGTGVEALNIRLQSVLNPEIPGAPFVKGGIYSFRAGDKVMQIKNNYDIVWKQGDDNGTGIFNGEIGVIKAVKREDDTVLIDFDGKTAEYSLDMMKELELSYAATIHKSQGSEFGAVILPLLGGYDRLYCRNLLYTAVTRAKKLLVLVGSRNVVCKMVDNNLQTMRYTMLEGFLKHEAGV
jgi:exodeoxyribonuclease V alpha subunit